MNLNSDQHALPIPRTADLMLEVPSPKRSMKNTDQDAKPSKPSLFQVMLSVMSAAIGVQRAEVRARDFQTDSPLPFIIAGIVFTLMFVGSLLLIVNWVI